MTNASAPPIAATQPDWLLGTVHSCVRLAQRYIVLEVEQNANRVDIPDAGGTHVRWWDIRPLIDEREQPNEHIDMNVEILAAGIALGLLASHPTRRELVRITRSNDDL
jgi:hypothetical protein